MRDQNVSQVFCSLKYSKRQNGEISESLAIERDSDRKLIALKDACSDRDGRILEERVEEYVFEVKQYHRAGYTSLITKHNRIIFWLFSRLERQNGNGSCYSG